MRSLNTGYPSYAWHFHFNSDGCDVSSYSRVDEHPVQPVLEKYPLFRYRRGAEAFLADIDVVTLEVLRARDDG